MTDCFRCGCPLIEGEWYMCHSCNKSVVDLVMIRQPKRFQGLVEKELARNKKEAMV